MVGRGKWHLAEKTESGIQQGSPTPPSLHKPHSVPAVVETGAVSQATLARKEPARLLGRVSPAQGRSNRFASWGGERPVSSSHTPKSTPWPVFRLLQELEALRRPFPQTPAGATPSRPLGLGGRGSWSAVAASGESRPGPRRRGVLTGGAQAPLWVEAGGSRGQRSQERPSEFRGNLAKRSFLSKSPNLVGASGCWFWKTSMWVAFQEKVIKTIVTLSEDLKWLWKTTSMSLSLCSWVKKLPSKSDYGSPFEGLWPLAKGVFVCTLQPGAQPGPQARAGARLGAPTRPEGRVPPHPALPPTESAGPVPPPWGPADMRKPEPSQKSRLDKEGRLFPERQPQHLPEPRGEREC